MTQEEYLAAMDVWADGERMVPEAFVGGLSNVSVHFTHWQAAADAICDGDRVLEAGCGCGLPARIYSLRSRCPVVAVDQDYAVQMAALMYPTPGVVFIAGDFNARGWIEGMGDFDVIVCTDVIEHVREKDLFLECLAQLSHPGTRFVLSVPLGTTPESDTNDWHLHRWPARAEFLADVGRYLDTERVVLV